MPEATPCVDDEALFALARGELCGAALERAEAHLQGCADCRAVLAAASEPFPEGAPMRIARYELSSLLGAGAAGVVYRAFDPQLKRAVALKLLRPELHGASREQSERMLREAQAMARLSDPHVVAVYDVGLHEGIVYLVMEFIDGHTLTEWLRAEPRALTEILRAFADAGQGLAAAHRKGLVHRDFKPANVLVARDGLAKVTDFGLARESESWLRERQLDDQSSTELYAPTRGLVGTPAYMAPELFEGGRASPGSDQFAFCVALFAAVFEHHPFKAGEGIALSELVARVRAGALQRPVFGSAQQARLFAVLRRGLSPTPEARFQDLAALLAALSGAARINRASALVVVALLTAALIGAAVTARALRAAPAPPPRPAAIAVSVPSVSAAQAATIAPPALESPTTLPSAAPKSTVAPVEKRRPVKPSQVRYKDWLKDPF